MNLLVSHLNYGQCYSIYYANHYLTSAVIHLRQQTPPEEFRGFYPRLPASVTRLIRLYLLILNHIYSLFRGDGDLL
jgi:hypothetical protein